MTHSYLKTEPPSGGSVLRFPPRQPEARLPRRLSPRVVFFLSDRFRRK